MNEQYEKSLSKLELDKVLSLLADHASSQAAKDRCMAIRPSADADEIRHLLEETSAACKCITIKGSPSFGGLYDVGASLDRAYRGGCLSPEELLRIAGVLRAARQAKSYAEGEGAQEASVLDLYFQQITSNKYLEERIFNSILSKDEIADAASSELASIRRKIRQQSAKIRESLQKIITSPSYAKILQEPIVTIRSDRFVVPVKAECKGQLPGLVHDVSSSGSTYFIEPMSAVNGNNELRELFMAERKEIERILAELSAESADHREQIKLDYDVLLELECIFARARLSFAMRAICPEVRTDGQLNLIRARHPLITGKTVVPISVRLGSDFDTLIITGPNTGGKTVTLKTIGLLTLMAECGLHIPADDGSSINVYEQVFADIGDEQSIEQSLSTFSSHTKNIVEILKVCDRDSLVLFDELCAGTDPAEGAALAIAIIEFCRKCGAGVAATTHYAELKLYAMRTSGVMNASCEFNVETLRPTYRLLIGVPGKSNAFAISSKLGLPDYIIDKAKEQISEQDESFEDVLSSLESSRITIENERREIEQYKQEIASLKSEMESKQEKLNEQRDRIIRQANEEAHAVLREAKEYADQTMKMFHKFQKDHVDLSAVEKERQNLRKHMNKAEKGMAQKTAAKKPKKELTAKDISLGDAVKVLSMNLKGTVSSRPDNKGFLFVQMGIIRSKVHISDLELIDEAEITTPTMQRTGAGKIRMSKAAHVSTEINLLGKTVDEAVAELDKYLDDAYIAHLKSVRIVHGKGTGALRKGIHNYLKRQKHVESFRLGEFGEGDAGVTIVEFKK